MIFDSGVELRLKRKGKVPSETVRFFLERLDIELPDRQHFS